MAESELGSLPSDADQLARRWAIALINARPLERIGEVPLELFAREAPSLLDRAVRALASEMELERLTAGGLAGEASARALWAITGARDQREFVEAIEALRRVLWDALLDQLHWPIAERFSPRLLADLADRLAAVCAGLLASALVGEPAAAAASQEPAPPGPRGGEEPHATTLGAGVTLIDEGADSSLADARGRAAGASREREPEPRHGRAGLGEQARGPGASSLRSNARPEQSPPFGGSAPNARPRPWDTPLQGAHAGEPATLPEPGEPAGHEGGWRAARGQPTIRVSRLKTRLDGPA